MMEWIISSSMLILIVLALRAVLGKRISAGLRYSLWAVVLVRLLVPVSFLEVTVPQLPKWDPPEAMLEESIYILPVGSAPVGEAGVSAWEDGSIMETYSSGYSRLEDSGTKVVRYAEKVSPLELLGWVWMAGTFGMGAVLTALNLRFFIRLRRRRRPLEGTSAPVPVYEAGGLPSPCLMGLLRPAVYVTGETADDPAMLRHVLAHELTHYNHLDHLWSFLRGIALAVHWWNPLVWLAVVCSRRDGELACDEGALKRLGDGERMAYGETLLALVTAKSRPGDLFCFATTMTGGKRSLKERIQRIACRPRQLVSAMAVVIAVLTLSAVVAFGQAKEAEMPDNADTRTDRPAGAWQTAQITVDENGIPHIDYSYGNSEELLLGEPIPAPREWADQDLAGRNEAEYLTSSEEIWAKLVSPDDGWLVAVYGRGVAAADTYVYKTEDGGMNWTEVTMPGTSWHISDVGFLSPDRLIVAQRLFDDAPCFITKDGGETWEEIELPDTQVLSIAYSNDNNVVLMQVGKHEDSPAACYMLSHDLGDTWTIEGSNRQNVQTDLDHNGVPDELGLYFLRDENIEIWSLLWISQTKAADKPYHLYWADEAASPHAGWTSFFLCRMDGEDYLLKYTPYMGGGSCDYSYKLFYLTASGEEVVVQEDSVQFDLIFDPDYVAQHQYDPWAINRFMEEVNALLANSEQLVNTDENLLGTFQKEGRLYDSVWWLDDDRDENLSLLENLLNYGNYAQDHPDDAWSPLADLLMSLTEEDIVSSAGDESELVNLLKKAERQSRFYAWGSKAEACLGHGAEEADYTILNLPLADSSTLWLLAGTETPRVLMIYETPEEAVSAFYDAPGLNNLIRRMSAPAIAEVMANISEENIENIAAGTHMEQITEGLHRISEKLSWDSNGLETDAIIAFIPVGYRLSPDEEYQHHFNLKATETENYLRIVCNGWRKLLMYSENPEEDGTYLENVSYKVVCYVEDAELYKSVSSWGVQDETSLERYQDD